MTDERLREALDRIEEAARTAIANLEECPHDCNDRSRALDRLSEIADLAAAALEAASVSEYAKGEERPEWERVVKVEPAS